MVAPSVRLILITLLLSLAPASAALAVPIDLSVVGIWSENPGAAAPGSGTGLAKGQKFVVNVTYDPAVTPLTETTVDGLTYYTVDLAGGAAPPLGGGLTGNGNSLDVLVPLEGLDTPGSPFVYTLDELDHRNHPGDPFPSPVTQLHFSDAAGTELLGFKLETFGVAGAPGGNFLQMQTEVASIDPGDGIPVPTATGVVQMRTGSFDIVIRSIDAFVDSVPVVAEAGGPLSYDASTLTATTAGGTFRNPNGTWQDNDLGAGRTDKEDFLTHTWSLQGSVEGGLANTPLVGVDVDAQRPIVLPSENPFVLQPPPSGTRAVEKVDKTIGIVDSGLVSTTDVATWQIAVSESLTGLDGGTDIVLVTYDDTEVVINTALATSVGDDLQFTLDVEDADLAINALGLVDFELLSYALLLDSSPFAGLSELIANGSQYLTLSEAIGVFGVGSHSLEVRVADRVLAQGGSYVSETINFMVVPEPGTAMLVMVGLMGLGRASSRRRVQ